MCFLDRLLQHLLPATTESCKENSTSLQNAVIISEVGDKSKSRFKQLFPLFKRVAINLEMKFKALDADYKD